MYKLKYNELKKKALILSTICDIIYFLDYQDLRIVNVINEQQKMEDSSKIKLINFIYEEAKVVHSLMNVKGVGINMFRSSYHFLFQLLKISKKKITISAQVKIYKQIIFFKYEVKRLRKLVAQMKFQQDCQTKSS